MNISEFEKRKRGDKIKMVKRDSTQLRFSLTLTIISFCSGDVRANTTSSLLIKTFQSSVLYEK